MDRRYIQTRFIDDVSLASLNSVLEYPLCHWPGTTLSELAITAIPTAVTSTTDVRDPLGFGYQVFVPREGVQESSVLDSGYVVSDYWETFRKRLDLQYDGYLRPVYIRLSFDDGTLSQVSSVMITLAFSDYEDASLGWTAIGEG